MPKLHEVMGEPNERFIAKKRSVLSALWTVKLGRTKFGNQAKPLKYSEKCRIS